MALDFCGTAGPFTVAEAVVAYQEPWGHGVVYRRADRPALGVRGQARRAFAGSSKNRGSCRNTTEPQCCIAGNPATAAQNVRYAGRRDLDRASQFTSTHAQL